MTLNKQPTPFGGSQVEMSNSKNGFDLKITPYTKKAEEGKEERTIKIATQEGYVVMTHTYIILIFCKYLYL
jgi:hypothetical protein